MRGYLKETNKTRPAVGKLAENVNQNAGKIEETRMIPSLKGLYQLEKQQ